MERDLGVVRAIIIVWVSGAVATALLSIFVSPAAWAMLAGSAGHIDRQWGVVALIIGVNALLGAIGVTIGVKLCGFRLSYPEAVLALAVGGIAAEALTRFLLTRTTRTADGLVLPGLTPFVFSLRLLLNILLPAYIVSAVATRRRDEPAPVEIPPYIPPPGRSPYA
jgi:hypothetical protein